MTAFRRLAAVVLASLLACSATAMADSRVVSPQVAADNNTMVQGVQSSLVTDGYMLDNIEEEPREYLLPPRAPYVWGNIVYTYSRQGHSLHSREKVEVVVKIKYLRSGVTVPELNVRNLQHAE